MATLMEQRDAAVQAATALITKAKNGELLTDEESADLEAKTATATSLTERIKQAQNADNLLKSLPAQQEEAKPQARSKSAASLGEHFVKSADTGALSGIKSRRRGIQVDAPEYKAPGETITTSQITEGAEQLLPPQIDKSIISEHVQRPTIASWLGAGTLTGSAITYFVEQAWEDAKHGKFGTVGESQLKPGLSHPGYDQVTESLKKIAGWIKISDEMAEDAAFLVSEINSRLLLRLLLAEEDQLLNGSGKGNDLKGIFTRDGVQSHSAKPADLADAVLQSSNKIFASTGLRPDGVVINPADYERLRLSKDGNGQYYAGGPFTGQYGVGGVLVDPPIWGLPVIQTTAVSAGTVLIGAGKAAATVYRKGGVRVEAANTNEDDFTHNRFTVLAEQRLTLAVRRPDAFVKLTLGGASPAKS
ncbi:phage major capsid protein [Acaricomes phytoseiuli]|uniref:phage major capsid protein n=1 Tax=Acaricomes phytoseiuli TaxID=291968 RepID=UPI0022223917|nr:phage major capsid protein [Acaricomes phytoseiuli]MCW1249656.1 phage major capsid protein [Acaricomes phytoseiuli]